MMKEAENMMKWYQEKFVALEKSLNGEAASPIHQLRKSALARFMELDFPTTRNEEWKYTNVAPIARTSFVPASRPTPGLVTRKEVEAFFFGSLNCTRLVFVNGFFSEELSSLTDLPKAVRVKSLAAALRGDQEFIGRHLAQYAKPDDDAFTALSTAFLQDGCFLHVPDKEDVRVPIHLVFVTKADGPAQLASPRNLIVVGADARVQIVESYVSLDDSPYFTNAVSEISLGEGAVIEHDRLQDESRSAYHIGTTHIHLSANSNFTSNAINLGGLLVRNTIAAVLDGERCECTLNGISLSTGKQHIDNHTAIDHAKPNCNSHELYKAVLDGESRGVFNGKIFVRQDAQKTDAKQTNQTLLLSENASMDTKPQLEIFADDVKCTHGATIGQLDEKQIFYLRSRGIGLEDARDILTFAFASDVVHRVHIEPLSERLDAVIKERLQSGRNQTR